MIDTNRGVWFFGKAADKFVFRLAIYIVLVLFVGFIAFAADLILEHYALALKYQAVGDGFISGFAIIVGLFFFELFLYGRSGWKGQLEAKARMSVNMLTTIAQAIPDLVYIKDAEGRHRMVNKAVEEFTGHTSQHFYGKTMADLLPSNLAASCMQSDREPIVTGKSCRVEEQFESAGGTRVLDTIKTPLRDDLGAIIGIVCVSRDITEKIKADEERQRLQTQLLQAQKLEALGHLAGGVAHDFNNILTVITGYASVLKSKVANDDLLVHQTEQILAASQRAKALARGLFAFSSKQKIETKPLNVNDIIGRSRRLLTHFVGDRVSIKTVCCATPLIIKADQAQLDRVLMNLATNAKDAMPDGGDLVFSTDLFEMKDDFVQKHGYGVPGAYARLAVSDTGTGISQDNMKKIFEPFFTTKEEGKGTGLGLAIIYGIIKQHGGFINVSSAPAQGTTFHIYLPLDSVREQ